MTRRVSTEWDLERYGGCAVFHLEIEAEYACAPASAGDPGERRLELDRVTCGGEPFTLGTSEEARIIELWSEEIQDDG